jgi:osmoprotectant transport system permease protein
MEGIWGEVARLSAQHLALAGTAAGLATLVGLPVGIGLTRRPGWRAAVTGGVNAIQTIPSLALFGLLIPIPVIGGIGRGSALTALFLYALLPVVRNTVAGILSVDPVAREAAIAMGATRGQVLWLVELPLAGRTILAGIRTAVVTSIGTATIAAAIGGGGLGELIFRGVASVDAGLLVAGSVPAAVMALAADGLLGWVERRLDWNGGS